MAGMYVIDIVRLFMLDHVMIGSCDPERDELRIQLSRKVKELEVRAAELMER